MTISRLIHAKQEAMERGQDRREWQALKRRRLDPAWPPVAVHETGHALANTVHGHEVTLVWCDPYRAGALVGQCHFLRDSLAPFNRAVAALAGSVAEYLAGFTTCIEYDAGDMAKALRHVARDRIPAAESAAMRLLVNHWPAVRAIANELVDRGELTGNEVRRLLQQHSSKGG